MDEELEEIRGRYLADLRGAAPALRAWWTGRAADIGERTMNRRWPTGLAGHPRVIAIFRDAYLEIEALNDRRDAGWRDGGRRLADAFDEGAWGAEDPGPGPGLVRHFGVLVEELDELAPDVADLVAGLVFVPVGLDGDDETV